MMKKEKVEVANLETTLDSLANNIATDLTVSVVHTVNANTSETVSDILERTVNANCADTVNTHKRTVNSVPDGEFMVNSSAKATTWTPEGGLVVGLAYYLDPHNGGSGSGFGPRLCNAGGDDFGEAVGEFVCEDLCADGFVCVRSSHTLKALQTHRLMSTKLGGNMGA